MGQGDDDYVNDDSFKVDRIRVIVEEHENDGWEGLREALQEIKAVVD